MCYPSKTCSIGLLLCLALVQLGSPAFSQESSAPSPPLSLSLEEAIRNALDKSPRLSAARFQVDASTAKISQARSGLYPRIDFSESFARTNNPAQAFALRLNQEQITLRDFDPARLNDPASLNNFASIFSLSMPIYDAGRIRIGLSQAKIGQEAASLSAERVRQEVITGVVASYAAVLLAQDQLGVVDQSIRTARANHGIVRSRHQSGLVVKSDLLRAEVRIAELEQNRLFVRSQIDVAMAALSAAMGVDTGRSFQPVPFEAREAGPVGSVETWLREALKNRPDLKQLKYRERMAEEELKKAKMAHLPGLYLSGAYEMDTEDFSGTANNYAVGVVMRLNLFSGFGMEAKVQEALADLQQMRALVKEFALAVEVDTRRAFSQARSAYDRIQVAAAVLNQAEEGLRIVRNRYENGLFTIVNLLDAEAALQQARASYYRSIYDRKVAMAMLHLAAGLMNEAFR
ncbi:MAG: TolC family protein [Deltaproteobacteria bacterium]|nr:TolC family protein [Deltaproteobacteria bacterium]